MAGININKWTYRQQKIVYAWYYTHLKKQQNDSFVPSNANLFFIKFLKLLFFFK